ncbi:MAG: hypothetical protein AAGG75_18305 [Bacteroidota bacterium]
MRSLFDLITIVRPTSSQLSGKMLALVEGVLSGKFKKKEDVIEGLFANNSDPEQSYRKLAQRTERHLTYLLMISHSDAGGTQQAYHECWANMTQAMLLFGRGIKKSGVEVARKVISKAEKYEYIYILAPLLNILERHYAYVEPNRRLYKHYAKAAKKNGLLIEIDTLSNRYYSNAMMELSMRSSYTTGIINKLERYTRELSQYVQPTVQVKYQYTVLEAVRCFALQDYSRAALICTETLKAFDHMTAANGYLKAQLLHIRSVAAIAAGQYDSADSSLRKAKQLAGKNINSWHILAYYRAICALHSKDYEKAYLLYKEAQERKPQRILAEMWAILHAYLYLFNAAEQLYTFGDRFRLGKFFNQTVEASQDKAGLNVNIIVADMLISLHQNRDRFLHRIEPVRNYVYRHLKGKATERVRLFLELLFLIPKFDFNPHRLEQASTSLCRKLKRRSVYANHNLEIEIVPFENLWEITLELLGYGKMERRKISGGI